MFSNSFFFLFFLARLARLEGSEGYLLNQFIASRTNRRSDEWGGSYANRTKLALEVVRRVRLEVQPEFVIIFRLSLLDLVPGGSDWPEVVALAKELEGGQAGEPPSRLPRPKSFNAKHLHPTLK